MSHIVEEVTKNGKRIKLSVSDDLYERHYRDKEYRRALENNAKARPVGMDWGKWAAEVVKQRGNTNAS